MTEQQNAGEEGGKGGFRHGLRGVTLLVVFILILGIFVMLLWNWLMPPIFRLGEITYLQAVGLMVLARLLFGRVGQRREHAGYLTGKYGFRSLVGRGKESAEKH